MAVPRGSGVGAALATAPTAGASEAQERAKRARLAAAAARATEWRKYTSTSFAVLYFLACFVPSVIVALICFFAVPVCLLLSFASLRPWGLRPLCLGYVCEE